MAGVLATPIATAAQPVQLRRIVTIANPVPTIIDAQFVRPDINLGVAYHRNVDWFEGLPTRVLVNGDVQRFITPGTPWWHQVKLGAAMEAQGVQIKYTAPEQLGRMIGDEMRAWEKVARAANVKIE